MALINADGARRIAEAINSAERKTSGEIVAVVANSSATYAYIPLLYASLIALFVPWPLTFFTWMRLDLVYLIQLVVFFVLALTFLYRPIRYALVPASIKRAQAHKRAVEQFLVQNLHTTDGRTGALVFVSEAERYAEIIADSGIRSKVADGTWKTIVDRLTEQIGNGNADDGFVEAVTALGQLLAQHFPPGSNDPDQLPNHLIVLES